MQSEDTPVVATVGIKETLEVFETVKVSLVQAKAALEDGTISVADLPKIWPLITSAKDAIMGASEIPAELMDLDQNEIKELISKIAEIVALALDLVLRAPKS